MALKVKPIATSTTKWADRARVASAEFAANAESAAADWAKNTQAAADNYGAAISAAGIKERFRRGVSRAGAEKFARKVRDVGADRFAPGVSAATTDYTAGAEPYYATLASITLPARKPRGDPGNLSRVDTIMKTLHAKRLALLGSGGG
jgi:hypothetical protein